jgi:hypothetical protein
VTWRSSAARVDPTTRVISLRSPLPLIVAGVCVTLAVIALVSWWPRAAPTDPYGAKMMSDREAVALVAGDVRNADVAAQALNQADARFEDGTWYVSVGDAQFHFSQRNRIVVADNSAAIDLQYRAR